MSPPHAPHGPPQVIAKNGDHRYLVDSGDGHLGFVADTLNRIRYQLLPIQSIARDSFWEKIEHDPELLDQLMKLPLDPLIDPKHRIKRR